MALIKVLRNDDHSTAKDTTVIVVRRALNALLEPWIADAKKELAEQLLESMPTARPSGKSNTDSKVQEPKRERRAVKLRCEKVRLHLRILKNSSDTSNTA